jgi:hypothetical protein
MEQKHLLTSNLRKSCGFAERKISPFFNVALPTHVVRVLAGFEIQVGIGTSESTPNILEFQAFKKQSALLKAQTTMEPQERKAIRTVLKDLLLNDDGIQSFVRDIRVSTHDPYRVFNEIVLHNKQAQEMIGQLLSTQVIPTTLEEMRTVLLNQQTSFSFSSTLFMATFCQGC